MIPFLLLWFLNWSRRSFFALHGHLRWAFCHTPSALSFGWEILGGMKTDIAGHRLSLQI